MLSTAVLLYHRYTVVRLSRTVCLSQAERCVRVADWQLRLMVSLVHSFSLSPPPPSLHASLSVFLCLSSPSLLLHASLHEGVHVALSLLILEHSGCAGRDGQIYN